MFSKTYYKARKNGSGLVPADLIRTGPRITMSCERQDLLRGNVRGPWRSRTRDGKFPDVPRLVLAART